MILEKIRSCFRILEAGFQTYGLIHLLGHTCPKLVFRPQTPRSGYFSKFNNFIEFIYNFGENEDLFVKIGARILDIWLDMSFGPKPPKCSF